MSDWYQTFANSKPGGALVSRASLPKPQHLRRYAPGQPLLHGPAMIVRAGGEPRLAGHVAGVLADAGAEVSDADADGHPAAIVADATGVSDPEGLAELHRVSGGLFKRLRANGRFLVIGSEPATAADATEAATRRALEGFVRSAAKECRGGSTANLLSVADGAENASTSSLRFFLSARSAYVSGQHVRVTTGPADPPENWDRPLAGRVALVTGAARGIGAAIAAVLSRDGASVVCLDIPAQGQALSEVANRFGGTAVQLDLTDADAPARLLGHLADRHGRIDLVVHNAGITADRLLVNLDEHRWRSVIDVNLAAQLAINDALLAHPDLASDGVHVVSVSSTSGIAGNRGQTNYAASKAGIIGMVQHLAPVLAERGGTINAVAPGFIETEMTARMPMATREAGRRINSLRQGGTPQDVAETIAWLGQGASGGVSGQIVRVCGQSMLGA